MSKRKPAKKTKPWQVVVCTVDDERWWVDIIGGNGEIVMTSELYDSASNAKRAARAVAKRMQVDVEK